MLSSGAFLAVWCKLRPNAWEAYLPLVQVGDECNAWGVHGHHNVTRTRCPGSGSLKGNCGSDDTPRRKATGGGEMEFKRRCRRGRQEGAFVYDEEGESECAGQLDGTLCVNGVSTAAHVDKLTVGSSCEREREREGGRKKNVGIGGALSVVLRPSSVAGGKFLWQVSEQDT
jgi:hypothetical protein